MNQKSEKKSCFFFNIKISKKVLKCNDWWWMMAMINFEYVFLVTKTKNQFRQQNGTEWNVALFYNLFYFFFEFQFKLFNKWTTICHRCLMSLTFLFVLLLCDKFTALIDWIDNSWTLKSVNECVCEWQRISYDLIFASAKSLHKSFWRYNILNVRPFSLEIFFFFFFSESWSFVYFGIIFCVWFVCSFQFCLFVFIWLGYDLDTCNNADVILVAAIASRTFR